MRQFTVPTPFTPDFLDQLAELKSEFAGSAAG